MKRGFQILVTLGVTLFTLALITGRANAWAPTANDDCSPGFSGTVGVPIVITSASVLANDTDPDVGDVLTVKSVANGSHGTTTLSADKLTITYTPAAGYIGTDSFIYTIVDKQLHTASAKVCLTVNSHPPVANDDCSPGFSGAIGASIVIPSATLLANDTDVDHDTLSITAVANGAHGTVTLSADKATVTYKGTAGYAGTDSFVYTISDGHGNTATAKVCITLNGPPACNVTGPTTVCPGSTNTWSEATGATGVTYKWTLTGTGTINGSSTGSSVSVNAGGCNTSFDLCVKTTRTSDGQNTTCCVHVASTTAVSLTWNFSPEGAQPVSKAYLDTSNTYRLTAYGYKTTNAAGATLAVGKTWGPGTGYNVNAGTITATALYDKVSTPDETGLGLAGMSSSEIQPNTFIQLNAQDLYSQGLGDLVLSISSIQTNEGFQVWGSNTLGVPGTLLQVGGNPSTGADIQTFSMPSFGTYKYFGISATSGDVLILNGAGSHSVRPNIHCPGDITVECGGSTDPAATGTATATSNCGATVTYSDVVTAGACAGSRTIARTWKATDTCGNYVSCTQTITVLDTTKPVIICPPAKTVECSASTLPANTGTAIATDTCDSAPVVTYTDVVTAGACSGSKTIARTWKATDACGNFSTCVQTITVSDTTKPVVTVVPTGSDLGCNPATLPTDASIKALVTATDNCTTSPTINVSHVDAGTTCAPSRTFTITATDACGNASDAKTVIYTWKADTTKPVVTVVPTGNDLGCNPTTLPTDDSIKALVTATDNCGTPTIGVTHVDSGTDCGKTRTFTITATDACGNASDAKTVIYTWKADTTKPVVTVVPTGRDLGCNPTTLPTDASIKALVTATDNCGTPTVGVTHVDSGTDCANTRTFTITATDACGNASDAKTVIYTWKADTTKPVVTVVPTGNDLGCNPTTLPTDDSIKALVTATDNCGTPTIGVTHIDSGTDCGKTRTFTITATDACGNASDAKTVIYTWKADTTKPVVTVVPTGCDLGCNPTTLPTDASIKALVTATDNCGGAITIGVTHVDTGDDCAKTRTFTITATDGCGNASEPKTVVDTWKMDLVKPVITVVPNGSDLGCNPTTLPTDEGIKALVTATDNCGTPTVVVTHVDSGDDCAKTRTFTITATDGCGNVSEAKTVVDTWKIDLVKPVITVVPNGSDLGCNPTTLPTDESIKALVTATDNCGTPNVAVTHIDTGDDCAKTRTFTITATDGCGNVSEPKTVVYTWKIDTTKPVITVVPNGSDLGCNPTTLPTDEGIKALVTATDNCGTPSVTVTHVDTGDDCAKTRTFTITATDGCGNVSEPKTVVDTWKIDLVKPVITVVPNGTDLGCNPTTLPTDESIKALVTATDNCGGTITIGVTHVDSGDDCAKVRTFTITATDACGNVSEPKTVVDTWKIDLVKPVITVVPNGSDLGCNPTTLPTDASIKALVTATDNCGGTITITVTHVDTGDDCAKTRTFTITATDGCGNVSEPKTVVDTWKIDLVKPVITVVPNGTDLGCNPTTLPTDESIKALVTATDNCGTPTVVVTHVDSGDDCAKTRTFTTTATDGCGNVSEPKTVVYTWKVDLVKPVITVVPNGSDLGCNPTTLPTDDSIKALVTATDNCGTPSVVVTHVDTGDDCAKVRTFTITATDACGNVSEPKTVVDTWKIDLVKPVITVVPNGTDLGCNPTTLPTDESIKALVTATDNCGTPTVVVTHVDSGDDCAKTRTFTTTATDGCGNVSEPKTVVYTWKVDLVKPVITVVPNGSDLGCNPTTLPTDDSIKALVTATDNCGGAITISVTHVDSGEDCAKTRTFTITATDGCGNVSEPKTVVDTWKIDLVKPVITVVPAGSDLGCNPTTLPTNDSIKALVTATDNCGTPSVTVTHVDTGDDCAKTRTFTITATDGCGNVSEPKTVVYTWKVDLVKPVITVVPNGSALGCNPTTLPTDESIKALVTATDNCGGTITIGVTHVDTGDDCAKVRTFTITATDGCGNVSEPKTVVDTWKIDTTKPVITVVPNGSDLGCNPTTLPTNDSIKALVTATDNCGGTITIGVTHVDSGDDCAKTRTFTITATDGCGNVSEPKTVVDTWKSDLVKPVVTVVPNGTDLGCNPTTLPTNDSIKALVTATDNCGTPSVVVTHIDSGDECAKIRTFTITAMDQCGNASEPKTVVYTWKMDTTKPTISNVPADITVQCDKCCSGVLFFGPDVTKRIFDYIKLVDPSLAAQVDMVNTGNTFDPNALAKALDAKLARDGKPYCSIVFDPEYIGPRGLFSGLSDSDQQRLKQEMLNGTGFVYVEPVNQQVLVGNTYVDTFPLGQIPNVLPVHSFFYCDHTQRYVVMDPNSPLADGVPSSFAAASSCQNTRIDILSPVAGVTYSGITPVGYSVGQPSVPGTGGDVIYTMNYGDNCSRVAIIGTDPFPDSEQQNDINAILQLYYNSVKWTLKSGCAITCGVPKPPTDVHAVDNCDPNPTLTFTETTTGSCPQIITRTWTATDSCGNTSTATQTITVTDTTPPVLACPADMVLPNDTGSCGAVVNFHLNAYDKCSDVHITSVPASGSFFGVGTTTVYVAAVDGCGNVSNCSFKVTVNPVNPGCLHTADVASALRIAAGLQPAPSTSDPLFGKLNRDDTGTSAGRIDMRDAVALAKLSQ